MYRIIKRPDVHTPASRGGIWSEWYPCYNERMAAMGHIFTFFPEAMAAADQLELQ